MIRPFAAATVAALTLAVPAHAGTARTVYVTDRSETVSLVELQQALPAFQQAVTEDFAPVWGQDAHLVLTDTPPANGWVVVVREDSNVPGALGYHGQYRGTAWARVFTAASEYADVPWQLVFTHELFEMLADPYVNRYARSTRLWLVEVADPVENTAFAYTRDGTIISDFVTPAWYQRWGRPPYDFTGRVQRPLQILTGGFASYWKDGWHQLFG